MKRKTWMEDAGNGHVWLHHTLAHTALSWGRAWLYMLEGNASNKVVEEYILTSTKSKIGNIGGKLLDYNHYYRGKKGFVSYSTSHIWDKFCIRYSHATSEKPDLKLLPKEDKTMQTFLF